MSKNKVDVVIAGLTYSLTGEESEAHIQQVGRLINEKYVAVQKAQGRNNVPLQKVHMLVALNVGDEYVKAREELAAYMTELEKCNAENLALRDKLTEITLELAQVKAQMNITKAQTKRNDYRNRGR